MRTYWITVAAVLTEVSCVAQKGTNSELTLIKKLLDGYDTSVRPVMDENDVLNLTITANSLGLLMMDQSQETALFSAEFILEWQDAFITWDPQEYNNLTWLKMKEMLIWRPDVTVSTSIEKSTLLDENERYIDIHYDGMVRQSLYAVYTNLCNMKVNRFPYDSQICMIEIGPWSYTADEVFCIAGPMVANNSFEGNSEWDYEGLTSNFSHSTDADVGFNYTTIRFWLSVKRRPLFYVWVLLIPTYIITMVCICGLFIPTNSIGDREERVNLGMTTLLSSTVILQIVADSMPKTSSLPLLVKSKLSGNFILAEIFVVAIGVLFSVGVLVLHQRSFTREWTPPNWVLSFLRVTGNTKFLLKHQETLKMNRKPEQAQTSYSGEGAKLIADMDVALKQLTEFVEDEEVDRIRELAWLKFFDRVDTVLLVIFQISNAILTYVSNGIELKNEYLPGIRPAPLYVHKEHVLAVGTLVVYQRGTSLEVGNASEETNI